MIKSVLQEIPIFENLDRDQTEELSSWLQRREIGEATTIIQEEEPSDGMYVLARGDVQVVKQTANGPLVIAELEAPSVIGEMGLLNHENRSAAVRTQTNVVVGFLPAKLFAEKLSEENVTALLIALNLGRIACQRLKATTIRLANLSDEFARHAHHMDSGVFKKVKDTKAAPV